VQRLLTTFLGMAKMNLQSPVPPERVFLLNLGQSLPAGDRELRAFKPPTFDAPETTGLVDERTRVLFSSDCFGALLHEPAESAAAMATEALRDGQLLWATIDAPWLSLVDEAAYLRALDRVRALAPSAVLSTHLPPAVGLTETLLTHLAAARTAPPFVGPDQPAFAQLLATAA
jgi:flavorubredoxin